MMNAILAAAAALSFHVLNMNGHDAAVVDERSVVDLPGGQKRLDLIAVFAQPTEFRGKSMRVSVTPYTFDCKTPRSYYGVTTYKTIEGETLVVDTGIDHTGQWAAISPDRMVEAVRQWACQGVTPQHAPGPFASLRDAEKAYLEVVGAK